MISTKYMFLWQFRVEIPWVTFTLHEIFYSWFCLTVEYTLEIIKKSDNPLDYFCNKSVHSCIISDMETFQVSRMGLSKFSDILRYVLTFSMASGLRVDPNCFEKKKWKYKTLMSLMFQNIFKQFSRKNKSCDQKKKCI